ncbi:hypothetical protein AAFF_G00058120 [Aldrovandia affinis]|uniref:Uncharacterized protein n=1 Tax=Aldrovandia affinis TaxID=143900 RepID=A0AAD7S0A2_9TELE|nr:hypothetical protein AAFF_G00058120 [Aldrovandia affinis]
MAGRGAGRGDSGKVPFITDAGEEQRTAAGRAQCGAGPKRGRGDGERRCYTGHGAGAPGSHSQNTAQEAGARSPHLEMRRDNNTAFCAVPVHCACVAEAGVKEEIFFHGGGFWAARVRAKLGGPGLAPAAPTPGRADRRVFGDAARRTRGTHAPKTWRN